MEEGVLCLGWVDGWVVFLCFGGFYSYFFEGFFLGFSVISRMGFFLVGFW